jgi:uncharacterized membrane protein
MRMLYLEGDACSPKYVAGALAAVGIEAVQPPPEGPLDVRGVDGIVLSDVTAARLGAANAQTIADAVTRGVGLLLVGGWTSFGRGGWAGTPLANISPVTMETGDDRVNVPAGLLLRRLGPHPSTDGLPWDRPVLITGYNRVSARPGTETVVGARKIEGVGDDLAALEKETVPILVLGRAGRGRTAVWTSDLAPHWSGGLTDWGEPALPVGRGEEVGAGYARLLRGLCTWIGQS